MNLSDLWWFLKEWKLGDPVILWRLARRRKFVRAAKRRIDEEKT